MSDIVTVSKNLLLRLPAELHERITALAKHERRSINSQIVYILENGIKQESEHDTKGDNKQQLLNRS